MKKIAMLLALLMLGSFSMPAKAITVTEKEMGYISVSTTATKEMTPDTAAVSFSVETTAKDSKTASEQNKAITAKLISSMKPLLELDKDDTIKTKDLNLRPNYNYDKGKTTLTGYTMVNTVSIKTKKLSDVPKMIDTAIDCKATRVSELRFFVENESSYIGRLVQEATANAKIISKLTAEALDQKVTGLKTINVTWGPTYENSDSPRMYSPAKAAGASSAATPVEPGKVKIQANVHAQFYVK